MTENRNRGKQTCALSPVLAVRVKGQGHSEVKVMSPKSLVTFTTTPVCVRSCINFRSVVLSFFVQTDRQTDRHTDN